ncbi:DUF6085 family protein [Micromonospora andamanensis]|uniref:DUF6085 family protein n=1 Tax=Micromonospora andamanensis TaxID=1287068 RepID=UPI0019521EB2|nr:DUF6085 family protein [Micromonospora andamanensis]GIJ36705.1 hypothetical protein Vwe01_00300 [Micromonospora andamanensis]
MTTAYTENDVQLAARALWRGIARPTAFIVLPPPPRCVSDAKAVLDALAAAGRIAPDDDPRHVIEFRADGWTLKHPLSCRPRLFECRFSDAAQALDGPPTALGRYVVDLSDDGQGGCLVIGARIDHEPAGA